MFSGRNRGNKENSGADDSQKVYVLVIYTGGTIGMKESPDGYVPEAGYLETLISQYPNFNDPDYVITPEDEAAFKGVAEQSSDLKPIPLHTTQDGYRIIYGILEYNPLLDSSNMDMGDWTRIATSVYQNYGKFRGFVILHGTDTMAYTSSALSFMLQHLAKAVVVTGSQVPLAQLRTDAIENFVGALIMAGRWGSMIPEASLFFNNTLFRGNRTAKVNASGFAAFDSPNYPPLAQIGVNVTVNTDDLLPTPSQPLILHKVMDPSVGAFLLFPGIKGSMVRSFLSEVKGAVVLTFGAGNGPDKSEDVMSAFTEASQRGVLMLNITQCLQGQVEAAYATGTALEKAGLIPGGDMTSEAALTKLSYILGRSDLSMAEKKEALREDIRGEVTPQSIAKDY